LSIVIFTDILGKKRKDNAERRTIAKNWAGGLASPLLQPNSDILDLTRARLSRREDFITMGQLQATDGALVIFSL
jgi:hypothetical protein